MDQVQLRIHVEPHTNQLDAFQGEAKCHMFLNRDSNILLGKRHVVTKRMGTLLLAGCYLYFQWFYYIYAVY